MKTFNVKTKKGIVNLSSKTQVHKHVMYLHRIGLHNNDINIQEVE